MARKNTSSSSARRCNPSPSARSSSTHNRGASKHAVASPARGSSQPAKAPPTPAPARSSVPAQTHRGPKPVSQSAQGNGQVKSSSGNGGPPKSQVKLTHNRNSALPSTHGGSNSFAPSHQRNGRAVPPPTGQPLKSPSGNGGPPKSQVKLTHNHNSPLPSSHGGSNSFAPSPQRNGRAVPPPTGQPLWSPTKPHVPVQIGRDSRPPPPPSGRPAPAASHSEGRGTSTSTRPPAPTQRSKTTAQSTQKHAAPQAKRDAKPSRVAPQAPFMANHSPPMQIRKKSHSVESLFGHSGTIATGYDVRPPRPPATALNTAPPRMHGVLKPPNHQKGTTAAPPRGNGARHPENRAAPTVARRSAPVQASYEDLARRARSRAQPTTSVMKVTAHHGTTVNGAGCSGPPYNKTKAGGTRQGNHQKALVQGPSFIQTVFSDAVQLLTGTLGSFSRLFTSPKTYSPTVSQREGLKQHSPSPKNSRQAESKSKALVRHTGTSPPSVYQGLVVRKPGHPNTTSALATELAAPLPRTPPNELKNKAALQTIKKHPQLFKITTPIKVGVFEKYVKDHPNQRFVKSLARGLKTGFWPWARTKAPNLPVTYKNPHHPVLDQDKLEFVRKQRDEEIRRGRWSKSFGRKLLPGMWSSPINAVPKHTPGSYRLINDQSRGQHALNSLIPKGQNRVTLDNIGDLTNRLLAVRKRVGNKRKLVLFKSDVKSAYRLMPMDPLWQIRQVVPVDGKNHVDRCNTFGNRAGGWIWNSFASSVRWIATNVKEIPDLLGYVDDDFSWELEGKRRFYKPYQKHLPSKQVKLLKLWDELGIPHEEENQLFGSPLTVLGYEVDPNAMTVKIPHDRKDKAVRLIRGIAKGGRSFTSKELESLAGTANYVLGLYPHLRPGLQTLYETMVEKKGAAEVTMTRPACRNLLRFADHLERAGAVSMSSIDRENQKLRTAASRC